MYAVGTSVLYARMGVCKIESIGSPPFQKNDGRRYYKLRAVFSSTGEIIYIPVDAASSVRPLIDSGEAAGCLEKLPRLKPPVFSGKRPAETAAHYQEMLASCTIKDCLLLLKEIYLKQKEFAAHGKRLGQVDVQYLKITERLACEELAAALHTTPDLMRDCLYGAMEDKPAS